jgi:hypothetical protein
VICACSCSWHPTAAARRSRRTSAGRQDRAIHTARPGPRGALGGGAGPGRDRGRLQAQPPPSRPSPHSPRYREEAVPVARTRGTTRSLPWAVGRVRACAGAWRVSTPALGARGRFAHVVSRARSRSSRHCALTQMTATGAGL